jgi:hypothetical protein
MLPENGVGGGWQGWVPCWHTSPSAGLPLAMPFTVQESAVLAVLVTVGVNVWR